MKPTLTPELRETLVKQKTRFLANPSQTFLIELGIGGKVIVCSAQDFIDDIDEILNKPQGYWK